MIEWKNFEKYRKKAAEDNFIKGLAYFYIIVWIVICLPFIAATVKITVVGIDMIAYPDFDGHGFLGFLTILVAVAITVLGYFVGKIITSIVMFKTLGFMELVKGVEQMNKHMENIEATLVKLSGDQLEDIAVDKMEKTVAEKTGEKESVSKGYITNSGWVCSCGRKNALHVTTCACGKNWREFR